MHWAVVAATIRWVDPITLVVAAVALGASAGLSDTVATAVKDAYATLKELLNRRDVDVSGVERQPDSTVQRDALREYLDEAADVVDDEILAAAQQVTEVVTAHDTGAGPALGMDLSQVKASFLRVRSVRSEGSGVLVQDGTFAGGIDIGDVTAGRSTGRSPAGLAGSRVADGGPSSAVGQPNPAAAHQDQPLSAASAAVVLHGVSAGRDIIIGGGAAGTAAALPTSGATEADRTFVGIKNGLGYHLQADEICPQYLVGRGNELADLADFCRGVDPYAWWQGPPYAGKSALAAWLVRHPPPTVGVVSFFVASRFPAEANSNGLVAVLTAQLRVLLEEVPDDNENAHVRRSDLHRRMNTAARLLAENGRRLLVVVDGLGEDRSAEHDLPSIASLLPRNPPDGIRFLITSRPLMRMPDDVHEEHPLRRLSPRTLAPSRHVGAVDSRANLEVRHLTEGDPLRRDVLGLLAVARRLAESELYALTRALPDEIGRALRSGLGHCLICVTEAHENSAQDPILTLAHDALRNAVLRLYGSAVAGLRSRIHDWAIGYRADSWPSSTPRYFASDYPSLFADVNDVDGLLACVADAARHDFMLTISGSDMAALSEIERTRATVKLGSAINFELSDHFEAESRRIAARSGLLATNDLIHYFEIRWSGDLNRITDLLTPVSLGATGTVWKKTDIDRLTTLPMQQAGRTRDASTLVEARFPLDRVTDECIDFRGSRVHVRIWKGCADEGDRIVVVLGALHDKHNFTVNLVEDLATVVSHRFLGGYGGAATWFDYMIRDNEHHIDNIVLESIAPPSIVRSFGRPWKRSLVGDVRFRNPSWMPTRISDLERVVGTTVECYPKDSLHRIQYR